MSDQGWRTPHKESPTPRGRGWPRGTARGRINAPRGRGSISPSPMIPLRTFLYGAPEEIPSAQPAPQSIPSSDIFEPILKPAIESILELNIEDYEIINPWTLYRKYLADNSFVQDSFYDRELYEAILLHLKCISIKHNYDENHQIAYSRANILQILHPKDWGITPFQTQSMDYAKNSGDPPKRYLFNYWTYIQAMFKSFYVLNQSKSHSWMFILSPDLLENPIPNWFFKWWEQKGATIHILPPELKHKYSEWVETSPHLQTLNPDYLAEGMSEFFFFAQGQLPWIWTWNIEINNDTFIQIKCLVRNFSIKWWSAILIPDKIKHLDKVIQNNKLKARSLPLREEFSLKKMHRNLQKKYPHESPDQIKIRLQKAYENQMAEIFSDSDKASQKSEDVPEHWEHHSTPSRETGPSSSKGKAILEDEDDFTL